jgi:hypothetical protein
MTEGGKSLTDLRRRMSAIAGMKFMPTALLALAADTKNPRGLNADVAYLRIVSIPTTSNPPNSYAFRNR